MPEPIKISWTKFTDHFDVEKLNQRHRMYDEFSRKLFFNKNDEPVNDEVTKEDLKRLEDKIDKLQRQIDLIFGDNVVINERFIELKKMEIKQK